MRVASLAAAAAVFAKTASRFRRGLGRVAAGAFGFDFREFARVVRREHSSGLSEAPVVVRMVRRVRSVALHMAAGYASVVRQTLLEFAVAAIGLAP